MIEFVVRRIMEMGEAEDPEKVWLVGRGRGRGSWENNNSSGGIDGDGDDSESYYLKDILSNEIDPD